jgi:hypothetical protein
MKEKERYYRNTTKEIKSVKNELYEQYFKNNG